MMMELTMMTRMMMNMMIKMTIHMMINMLIDNNNNKQMMIISDDDDDDQLASLDHPDFSLFIFCKEWFFMFCIVSVGQN